MISDHSDLLVAPLAGRKGPAGVVPRKPRDHRIMAVVPHLDRATAEPLGPCLDLLRLQTERPYLVVIDTGSPWRVRAAVEQSRAPDCEIHYIRGHAWDDSSEPIVAALDLGFALSRGCEYVFLTHSDCFLRRRTVLEWLLAQCNRDCPVVAYRMSPRGWAGDFWAHCPGHVCSLWHAPTYHRLGLSWSMQRMKVAGEWEERVAGWPDTETGMGHRLMDAGIVPHWVGNERNWARQTDENIDHARSFSGARIYGTVEQALKVSEWMEAALAEARERVLAWRKEAPLASD